MILAIDPGTTESAWVLYDGKAVWTHGKRPNDEVLRLLGKTEDATDCAIEMVASYGMAVGAEVFHTVLWAGRFYEAAVRAGLNVRLVYRKQVALHICRDVTAGDANIRVAVIDLFGGKEKAVGKKKTPGPLYGFSGDERSALAVAITASETREPAAETKEKTT